MSTYTKAVNSNAFSHLKELIGAKIEVLDVEVRGKWLVGYLSSNIKFWVLNK